MSYAASSIRIPQVGNPHQRVRILLEQMKVAALAGNEAKADDCSTMLETLTAAYMDPKIFELNSYDKLGLTTKESRIITILRSRPGHVFPRDTLMNALYFDKPDGDWPEPKIIDVFICKLRRKIAPTGCGIQTVYGRGYEWVDAQRSA